MRLNLRQDYCIEADQLGRLRDIFEAARLIAKYKAGRCHSADRNHRRSDRALARRNPAVPALRFEKMRGMRNIVDHDYGNANLSIVWEVALVHVPEVCAVLEQFFAERGK